MKTMTYLEILSESASAACNTHTLVTEAIEGSSDVAQISSDQYLAIAYTTDTLRGLLENLPDRLKSTLSDEVKEAIEGLYIHRYKSTIIVDDEDENPVDADVYNLRAFRSLLHLLHTTAHNFLSDARDAARLYQGDI
jgi:hypothetical protein